MTDLNAKIIPLHSEVEGRVPTDAQLDVGELSYNITDRKIYTKDAAGNIVVMGAGADEEDDGLPGGGFKPGVTEGVQPIGRWIYRGLQENVSMCGRDGDVGYTGSSGQTAVCHIDEDGKDLAVELQALETHIDAGGTVWIELDGTKQEITPSQTNNNYDAGNCRLYFRTSPSEFAGQPDGTELKIWAAGETPNPTDDPLYDGDILRYDGTNWRPLQHTLENLDNVSLDELVSAPNAAAGVWTLVPMDADAPLASGAAIVDELGGTSSNKLVYLSPIDANGIDHRVDVRRWFEALKNGGDTEFFDGTVTFYKGGVDFPIAFDRIRDAMNQVGDKVPAFGFGCDFRDLYGDTESDSGDLGIREFDAFLGLEQEKRVPVGSTLQYNGTSWMPQLLDFSIEDANDFALRIDSGSGSELPKTTGDALVWDGTNWVPANVASFLSISDLSDVNTVTNAPTNGQVLTWDETQGYWKPADGGSGGGGDLQGTTESGNTTDQGIFITKANGDAAIDLENTGAATVRGLLQVKPSTRGEKIRLHSGAAGSVNLGVSGSSAEDIFEYNVEDGNGSHKFSVGTNEVMLLKALNIEAKQKVISPATIADDPGTTLTTKKFVEDLIELATGGGLSGAGALTERADVTVSNAYIDGQSRDEVFVGLGEAGTFVQVTVSNPAWVRFYATAADRTSDSGRQFDIDPLPGSGVLMELKTTQSNQVVKITPAAIYYNNDTLPDQALYARIRNEAGEDTTIAVTVRAYTQTDTDTIDGGSFGSG